MAKHAELQAEQREMLGKKVRRLRAQGVLPATVYGHAVTPVSIQIDAHDFQQVLKSSGRTQLIDLSIGSEKARPVFVKQIAVDAKRNAIQHVEFFQANLLEKTHATVPIHFVGESQAVKDGGILLTLVDHVEVESLPDDIPAGFDVDISALEELNSALHMSDITPPEGVALLSAPDDVICKVDPPVSEEALEEAEAAAEPLPAELGGEEPPAADAIPES
jgi:large subunit ribosomal protein L25